ncbi:uncharacterized protein TNCV_469281 [Trichonephila clavipes]|nr:uncharacterized protein TNCV_469281 [Trichonephila clavipes]
MLDVPLHHKAHVTMFEHIERSEKGYCHLGTRNVLQEKNLKHRVKRIYENALVIVVCDHHSLGSEKSQSTRSKHDFAASKSTDHDVVGDEIENNSANPQTLVVENQHINPPEEPEYMANADYDALKKPVCVFFYFKPLPKATQSRTELDQILEIVEEQKTQITTLQETKLKETHKIKEKGYDIVRNDRQDKVGYSLALLIKDINFASINPCSTTDSGLEL